MIIFETNIKNFLENRTNTKFFRKIKEEYTKKIGRRPGDGEFSSWVESLEALGDIIEETTIAKESKIFVEFQLPYIRSRVDVVICGRDEDKNDSALIIELKRWTKAKKSNIDGMVKTHVAGKNLATHPSLQAQSYKEDILDLDTNLEQINLVASSFLHNYDIKEGQENQLIKYYFELVEKAPLFSKNDNAKFVDFLNKKVGNGVSNKAYELFKNMSFSPSEGLFETGRKYEKTLDKFMNDINLYGDQRSNFRIIKENIDKALLDKKSKNVFVINGASGTGKTIVALKLFLNYLQKRILLMFPGHDFRNTMKKMFNLSSKKDSPFKGKIKGQPTKSIWLDKNEADLIIVDEMHKLPLNAPMSGIKPFQDVLDKVNNVIIMYDKKQIVNKQSLQTMKILDENKNGHNIIRLDLSNQFRSAGSNEFIEWLDRFLYEGVLEPFENTNKFSVKFYEDENTFIKDYLNSGESNRRLLSLSTSFDWTKKVVEGEPYKDIKIGNKKFAWYLPDQKTIRNNFQGIQTLRKKFNFDFNLDDMAVNSVGYYNTVQGSEFNDVWIYIGEEIYLNNNGFLDFDEDLIKMKRKWGTLSSTKNKKGEELVKIMKENLTLILNRIRILASRARNNVKIIFASQTLKGLFQDK